MIALKTSPYAHQVRCLKQFGRREYFALLAEMGTGKTWIIINDFVDLWSTNDLDAVLILAPSGVQTNWTSIELPKHLPASIDLVTATWPGLNKAGKAKLDTVSKVQGAGPLRVVAMNWEALGTKRGLKYAMQFLKSARAPMIVADESDFIKNPSAIRTKNLMLLKHLSAFRRNMTGTMINNAPFDAFSQMNFLHSNILNCSNIYAFKAEHAELLPMNNELVRHIIAKTECRGVPQVVATGIDGRPKYRNLDKLAAQIAPHAFRVLKSECLDLPKKIYKTVVFKMTPSQTAIYRKAAVECRLIFEQEVATFSKLVAAGKLAQITSGYYLHPDSDEPVRIDGPNPKLDLLEERVRVLVARGEKVIVWARYRVQIADIVERLTAASIEVIEYHGGVKKKDRPKIIERFENGTAEVFVANQQTAGTGLTIVAAKYVFYFSNDFSYRNRVQSEDRSHRIGQRRNVTYTDLIAQGTIDETVIKSLAGKEDVARSILDRPIAEVFEEIANV